MCLVQQPSDAPPMERHGAAVLDADVLAQLDELGPEVRAELAGLFAVDAAQRLAELAGAADALDVTAAATAAHALKGASLAIGACGVTARAAGIEARAQQGQVPAYDDLAALRAEVDAALHALATT